MANAADMMMARDATARAWRAVVAAEAQVANEVTEANCAAVARANKVWVRAVKSAEAVQRRVWAAQDRAVAA